MSTTSIGWTDLTLNPVIGCTHAGYQGADGKKVAHPGCLNCYAEGMCSRKLPGFTGHNACSKGGKWTGEIEVIHERLAWPFTRKEYRPRRDGKQRRCFLTSLSDMGHPALAESDWMAVQGMMLLSPWITWQDLTKRPERQRALLEKYTPAECVEHAFNELSESLFLPPGKPLQLLSSFLPDHTHSQWSDFPHIHRYVSVSDQATADALIPELLRMPCAVRGVSLEPMIGPVDIERYLRPRQVPNGDGYGGDIPVGWTTDFRTLNHVIVGGESGRGKGIRPFALEWALDIVQQCERAEVPCFVKQMGSKPICESIAMIENYGQSTTQILVDFSDGQKGTLRPQLTGKGDNPLEWPEVLRVQQNVGDV